MNPASKLIPLTVVVALLASGCARDGYYYDRNEEYRNARMTEPLNLPESRQPGRYQDAMPVPRANSDFLASSEEFDAPRPQPLAASRQGEEAFVEMREAGADRWLLVNAAPASVWPRLQGFVEQRGLEVTTLDPANGRIETDQAVLRVRQGLRGNTSEVRCENLAASAGAASAYDQCLAALNGYLTSMGAQDQSVSLAAQTLSRNDRVRLENQAGEWYLLLSLGFDRAWSELHYQLENSFDSETRQLVDQNRSTGELLVDYAPRNADRGGFLGFFEGDAPVRRYRLQVESAGPESTRVNVAPADGEPLSNGEARELLDALATALR